MTYPQSVGISAEAAQAEAGQKPPIKGVARSLPKPT